MRGFFLFSAFVFLTISTIHGQIVDEGKWMFHLSGGGTFRLPNDFAKDLNVLLNETEVYPQAAVLVGAGATYVVSNRFSLGAEAFGMFYPSVAGIQSQVDLVGAGALVKTHYRWKEAERWALWPTIGLGVYRSKATISNSGFLVNLPPLYIPEGDDQSLFGQMAFVDIGVQAMIEFNSYLMGSISAGLQQKIIGSDWQAGWGERLTSFSPPAHSMFYGKLSLIFKRP